MASVQNRGVDMLSEIQTTWQIKAGHCEELDDGFNWWPGHHKVSVRCAPRAGTDTWRLSVRTEYLKGINFNDPDAAVQIFGMGAFAPTYCWAFMPPDMSTEYKIPSDGSVYLYSSTYVRPATEKWLPRLFAQLSIMQAIDAQRTADSFGEMLKGVAHKSGMRIAAGSTEIDPMLYAAQEILAPAGKNPSRWIGAADYGAIIDQFGQTDATVASITHGGVTLQTSFGADAALLTLRHDIPHPALGAGLLATIRSPLLQPQIDSAQTCMWLNYRGTTSWTDAPIHGTWHPQQVSANQFCPAYAAFIPNALYSDGLATNAMLWNLSLIRWARKTLWPQLSDLPIGDVLATRKRVFDQ